MAAPAYLMLLGLVAAGWAAVRFARARRYRDGCLVTMVACGLGMAALTFATWLVLRVDDYPFEVVPSGAGLLTTTGLLYFLRSRSPQGT